MDHFGDSFAVRVFVSISKNQEPIGGRTVHQNAAEAEILRREGFDG